MVILADIDYPGWRLTIDGRDAPIHRVNRLMRGAAVPAGRHRLAYTFAPKSFRVGGAISLAAGVTLAVLGLIFVRWPVSTRLVPDVGRGFRVPEPAKNL